MGLNINGPYNANNAPSTKKLKEANNSTKKWKDYYKTQTSKRSKIFELVTMLYPYMGDRRREKMDEFLFWYENLSTPV